MTFDQAMRADRWQALTLGIPGKSPGADASRLRTARRVEREYAAYSDRVYARATGTVDPDPQHPFCLYRLINAGGNIQRVVDAPDFAAEILHDIRAGTGKRSCPTKTAPAGNASAQRSTGTAPQRERPRISAPSSNSMASSRPVLAGRRWPSGSCSRGTSRLPTPASSPRSDQPRFRLAAASRPVSRAVACVAHLPNTPPDKGAGR